MMIDLESLKPFRYELCPKGRKPKKQATKDISHLKGADTKSITMIMEEASHD